VKPSLLESKADPASHEHPRNSSAGQTATASGSGVTLKELPKREMARKLDLAEPDAGSSTVILLGDSGRSIHRYNARQLVIARSKPRHSANWWLLPAQPTSMPSSAYCNRISGIRVKADGKQLVLAAAAKLLK